MDLTGNYNLKKPGQNDAYNIQNENDNMDLIDQNMKRIDDSVKDIKLDAANVTFTSSITEFASKNVKLALDYLFQLANNGKKYWVDVVGSPLAIADTFATLKSKTQVIKNIIATNIVSKGVAANGTDSLNGLADAISKITIEGMGGKKWNRGTFHYVGKDAPVVLNVGFTPSFFIAIITPVDANTWVIMRMVDYNFEHIYLTGMTTTVTHIQISGSIVTLNLSDCFFNITQYPQYAGTVNGEATFDWYAFK